MRFSPIISWPCKGVVATRGSQSRKSAPVDQSAYEAENDQVENETTWFGMQLRAETTRECLVARERNEWRAAFEFARRIRRLCVFTTFPSRGTRSNAEVSIPGRSLGYTRECTLTK